jgi:hypothetical protein
MRLRGVVRTADLQENPAGSDRIEMTLKVQGVGPGQPRSVVIPFELLLENEALDPEGVSGRGFDAEVSQDEDGRWVVSVIAFASKVLRPEG